MNKIIKNILLFSFTGILLWFSLKDLKLEKLKEAWQDTDILLLTFTSILAILSHVIRAERWKLMLSPIGYKTSVVRNFYAVMIGYFVNLAIPRGGELSRCVSLKETDDVPVQVSLGTVVAERVVDLFFMLLLLGVTLLVEFEKIMLIITDMYRLMGKMIKTIPSYYVYLIIVGVLAICGILFYLYRRGSFDALFSKGKNFLIGIKQGMSSLFKLEKMGLFIIYSVLIWILYYSMTYFGMKAFPSTSHLTILAALTLFAASGIAMTIPLPGGAGSYHTIIPAVLLLYSVSSTDGAYFATIFHLWQTLTIIAIGSICLILGQIKSKNATS